MAENKREPKQYKVEAVQGLLDKVRSSKSAVITGYSGLTVEEVTQLRAQLFHAQVDYQVVKNNLARLALNQAEINVLDDLLVGPTAIALAQQDALSSMRVLSKFAKEHDKLQLKGGWMDGRKLSAADIKTLANLPSREVLLSKILGSMKSPVTGIVMVLAGPMRKLVYALNAVKELKAKTA